MKQEALVSLLQASTVLSGIVHSCVDRKLFPFTKTQMNIFTLLDMKGDLSMKRIAQLLATSQEQTTRAVAPLADAGYVERITDPSNRTRIYIHLTENGKITFEENKRILIDNLHKKLNDHLNSKETASLCEAASEIVTLLDKLNY